ncbi:BatD family protein [Ferrimonas futtsuensis]|uniref:BatD family protein n=1 Tax=Ferrimonas futtsuensis TaxID=364764 RepID=UPI00041B3A13|nr:BatD family protein [Ferrimonas futtsuensis]
MVTRLTLLLALLMSPMTWAYTSLTASVDNNTVRLGHSFVLNVLADDELSSNALDTTPLLEAFNVVRNNVSRSTQIINFNARKETRWQLLLIPKHTGTLLIPSLEAEGLATQAITLTVVEESAEVAQTAPVFLRATLADEEVWLGQPVDYRVKLYLAAELQRGSLSEPKLDGASVVQLGQDSNTTEMVDGRRYRVIERHYLITPQQSGEFMIQGSDFGGDILRAGRSNDLFSRSLSTPVQVVGQAQPIKVKAPPASFSGPWLVANAVALTEQWSPQQSQVRVGEPLTRVITLTAVGATEASLPTLRPDYPQGLKSYPDKDHRSDQVRNKEVVAKLEQSTALVASQPGTYTLPELKIAWWNAKLNRQQWATLPARTLTVFPGENQPALPPPGQAEVTPPQPKAQSNPWFYSTWVLLLALVASLYWGYRRSGVNVAPHQVPAEPEQRPQPASAFERAVNAGDLNAALQALPSRLNGLRGHTEDLAQVRRQFPELTPELDQLMRQTYGPQTSPTDLGGLARQVALIKQKKEKNQGELPDLNPM